MVRIPGRHAFLHSGRLVCCRGAQYFKNSMRRALPSCKIRPRLLEAMTEAARSATSGDKVLLSTASSSFDQFRKDQQCRESICQAAKSIPGGVQGGHPNMIGRFAIGQSWPICRPGDLTICARGFSKQKPWHKASHRPLILHLEESKNVH